MAGQKQKMAPMWKKLMKNVDLDEPTSFLDNVHLEWTQREEQKLNYQGGKSLTQRRLRGPATWKDMHKNALRETANWQTRRQSWENSFKSLLG